MTPREYIVAALRASRLLSTFDRARFLQAAATARADNAAFRRERPEAAMPPLSLCYDAYGHARLRQYFESGIEHADFIAQQINAHAARDAAVLEWGCGPGRVIRHLAAAGRLLGTPILTGCDYNARTIAWCRHNLPWIEFARNDLAPPLPFAAERFDVVYGLSVVTHLSAPMHAAWSAELRRVLRPGGVLIITTQGDWFRDAHLLPGERAEYDRGQLVVRGGVTEGKKWFSAFQPPAYMRTRFFAGWQVIDHLTRPLPGSLEQDVWIAQK